MASTYGVRDADDTEDAIEITGRRETSRGTEWHYAVVLVSSEWQVGLENEWCTNWEDPETSDRKSCNTENNTKYLFTVV
jgi:hypothetical protein